MGKYWCLMTLSSIGVSVALTLLIGWWGVVLAMPIGLCFGYIEAEMDSRA